MSLVGKATDYSIAKQIKKKTGATSNTREHSSLLYEMYNHIAQDDDIPGIVWPRKLVFFYTILEYLFLPKSLLPGLDNGYSCSIETDAGSRKL